MQTHREVKATIVSVSALGLNIDPRGVRVGRYRGMGAAQAHPLGNFTINHLARLQPEGARLRVHYVLDIAEIPTFQIMHGVAAWNRKTMHHWRTGEALSSQTVCRSGKRRRAALHLEGTRRTRPGAGGLPILYWTAITPAASGGRENLRTRFGLRGPAYRLEGYHPSRSRRPDQRAALVSQRLIGSPRQNDAATFDMLGGGRIARRACGGDDATTMGHPRSFEHRRYPIFLRGTDRRRS